MTSGTPFQPYFDMILYLNYKKTKPLGRNFMLSMMCRWTVKWFLRRNCLLISVWGSFLMRETSAGQEQCAADHNASSSGDMWRVLKAAFQK